MVRGKLPPAEHTCEMNRKLPKLIEDADVHYGRDTRPQGDLPFSIRVRRRFRWWPGPERHGALIDRLLIFILVLAGIVWAAQQFGWILVLFIATEVIIIGEMIYRLTTGNLFR